MTEKLSVELAKRLDLETKSLSIQDTIRYLLEKFPGKVSFSTSFGYEDQVITDMIFAHDLAVSVFTLDTGRHFEETYKVHSSTLQKYQKAIQVYHPDKKEVEDLLTEKGPFSFYESLENRKECCNIRKVLPLKRALSGVSVWITGIRGSQSQNREHVGKFQYDSGHGLIKYNPLIDWSFEETKAYIKDHYVPYNSLHDKGFVSIGCAPCTRAIKPGQDFRAGRWWWENNSSKECGLHATNNDMK